MHLILSSDRDRAPFSGYITNCAYSPPPVCPFYLKAAIVLDFPSMSSSPLPLLPLSILARQNNWQSLNSYNYLGGEKRGLFAFWKMNQHNFVSNILCLNPSVGRRSAQTERQSPCENSAVIAFPGFRYQCRSWKRKF